MQRAACRLVKNSSSHKVHYVTRFGDNESSAVRTTSQPMSVGIEEYLYTAFFLAYISLKNSKKS